MKATLTTLLLATIATVCTPAPATVQEGAGTTAPASSQRAIQPESGSDLFIPPGWHVRRETHPDKVALFVTKEDIETSGGFLTGFSLNHFPDLHANKKVRPADYAAKFAQQIKASHPEATLELHELAPGVLVHGVRFVDTTRLPKTILMYLVSGNDARDTLSLAWYESPVPVWDAEWKHGEVIVMDHLRDLSRAATP